jgi:hypothetical protein
MFPGRMMHISLTIYFVSAAIIKETIVVKMFPAQETELDCIDSGADG